MLDGSRGSGCTNGESSWPALVTLDGLQRSWQQKGYFYLVYL